MQTWKYKFQGGSKFILDVLQRGWLDKLNAN